METNGTPVRSSLWHAGLQRFCKSWREWARAAVVFFGILIVISASLVPFLEPLKKNAVAIILQSHKDPLAILAFLKDQAPLLSGYALLMVLAMYAQYYVYLSIFLAKEFPASAPRPTIREFFCFLSKNVQLLLLFLVPGLIVGLLIGVAAALSGAMKTKSGLTLMPIVTILAFLIMMFFGVRCILMQPLAALKTATPIKTSWIMTRHHMWRLIGNTLLMFLIALGLQLFILLVGFLLSLIAGLTATLVLPQSGGKESLILFVQYVVSAFNQVTMSGLTCAYFAAACRILYEEKTQADPAFALVQRI